MIFEAIANSTTYNMASRCPICGKVPNLENDVDYALWESFILTYAKYTAQNKRYPVRWHGIESATP